MLTAALLLPLCAPAQSMTGDETVAAVDDQPRSALSVGDSEPVATTAIIGYFSYANALRSLTEYAEVEQQLDLLAAQYAAETKRVEEEFNTKYENFLKEQKDLAPAIMQKRQAELQDLMEKNIAFRKEAQRLLSSARDEALAPLKELITTTLQVIGQEHGYVLVVNTDADACPYLDPERAEDIEDELISRLNER